MELSERIRRARQKAKLTQQELGKLVGVDIRTVQGWEAGRTPRVAIEDLERALGADLTTPTGSRSPALDEATEAQIFAELANRIAERDRRIRDLTREQTDDSATPDNVYDGSDRWAARANHDRVNEPHE